MRDVILDGLNGPITSLRLYLPGPGNPLLLSNASNYIIIILSCLHSCKVSFLPNENLVLSMSVIGL